ncbi:MAG: hypothetical protein ACR2OU_19690 [Thermomicrobiales bacterium]
MLDYHVQTTRLTDCNTQIKAASMVAIERGFTESAFIDHIDHEPAEDGFDFFSYEAHREGIARGSDRHGDCLVVPASAEVEFSTRIAGDVGLFLSNHAFSFQIGPVHEGETWEITSQGYLSIHSPDDGFPSLYKQIHGPLETGWFDTTGHLDLPELYAPQSTGTYVHHRNSRSRATRPDLVTKATVPGSQIVSRSQSVVGE